MGLSTLQGDGSNVGIFLGVVRQDTNEQGEVGFKRVSDEAKVEFEGWAPNFPQISASYNIVVWLLDFTTGNEAITHNRVLNWRSVDWSDYFVCEY